MSERKEVERKKRGEESTMSERSFSLYLFRGRTCFLSMADIVRGLVTSVRAGRLPHSVSISCNLQDRGSGRSQVQNVGGESLSEPERRSPFE
jgi:hypothetical protein